MTVDADELVWSDATAQAEAIRDGAVTAEALLDVVLARVAAHDGLLRAYVSLDEDGARRAARAVDQDVAAGAVDELGPFAGVTLSIKDVIGVAGLPTTHSAKALADAVAATDDPLVDRFRRAGAVVVGTTNVPEFCTSFTTSELNGVCRNPWDTRRSPAGSSGGAAVALAAGMCAAAHGTDGAGSVRTPASFCGLVGLKPSRGLVGFAPDERLTYFGTSVDGVLTRSVRDAAALLDVMTGAGAPGRHWGPVPTEAHLAEVGRDPGRLRVAVCTEFPLGAVEAEVEEATRDVAELLAGVGHRVEAATPDWLAMLAVAAGPMSVPGPAGLVGLDQLDLLEPRNRPVVEAGTRLTVVEHARWAESVVAATASFLTFWRDWDVLLTPTAGILPPSVDWAPWDAGPDDHMARFADFANFPQPFNLSGQPALSLPLAWSAAGLPIGVHLAGRPLEEGLLLRVAAQLESLRPWSGRRPPL